MPRLERVGLCSAWRGLDCAQPGEGQMWTFISPNLSVPKKWKKHDS